MFIYKYIRKRKLCARLCRKRRRRKSASHVFPFSLHIWELSSPSSFTSYIYIYIYTHTHTHIEENFALNCEGKGGGKVHCTFPLSPFPTTFESSPFLLLSPLIYIYITLPGLILKQSTFKVPLILIPEVSQKRTQIMKQSHIMGFATNLLSFTNMVAITNLLGILMVVTTQIRWL